MNQVGLGDTVYTYFGTSSASTGAAANADSTPTVTVAEDGVAMGYSPSVSNVITGLYMVTLVCTNGNGFEAGRRYNLYASATVGGISGNDGIGEFEILALDINSTLNATVGSRLSLNQFIGLK